MGATTRPTTTMDSTRLRLVRLVGQRGFSLKGLSLRLGKNAAYLQQFVTRKVPTELPYEYRVELASLLQCSVDDLSVDKTRAQRIGDGARRIPPLSLDGTIAPAETIPVLGRSNGAGHMKIDEGDEVARVAMPPFLSGVTGAYAVYVPDDTLSPVLRRGCLAYVNPARPVDAGHEAVIRFKDGLAMIRIVIATGPKEIAVAQTNPERKYKIPMKDIEAVHLIVGSTRVPI